jgi:hypothetical protein
MGALTMATMTVRGAARSKPRRAVPRRGECQAKMQRDFGTPAVFQKLLEKKRASVKK